MKENIQRQYEKYEKYIKVVFEQQMKEAEDFANGKEGWYNGYYYVMRNGRMTPVESAHSDDPPYYPD